MLGTVKQLVRRLIPKKPQRPSYLPPRCYRDDVYLVAYPKSGMTWLCFLVGNYLSHNQCDWTNSHKLVPDVHFAATQWSATKRPRFIKSHMPHVSEYGRVIYLVRDGRDVAVSYYYYLQRFRQLPMGMPFADYIERFNTGDLDSFCPWGEHVMGWTEERAPQFMLLRYEDMKKDAARALANVIAFGGLQVDHERVRSAVEASSFERMKKLEQMQEQDIARLASQPFDQSIPFMRQGKVGGAREHFDATLHERFLATHRKALERIGYPTEAWLDTNTGHTNKAAAA